MTRSALLLCAALALGATTGCDAYGNPLQTESAAPAPKAVVTAGCDTATLDLSGYPDGSRFIFGIGQQPPWGPADFTFDGSYHGEYTVSPWDLANTDHYGWTLSVNDGETQVGSSITC